jgi:hypothetical protein
VESRSADIAGHVVPSWQDVVNRTYEPWDRERVILDTATGLIDQLVDRVETIIGDKG